MPNRTENAFLLTNDRIIMPGIEFLYVVMAFRTIFCAPRRVAWASNPSRMRLPSAASTRILVNRHKSDLGIFRGVKM